MSRPFHTMLFFLKVPGFANLFTEMSPEMFTLFSLCRLGLDVLNSKVRTEKDVLDITSKWMETSKCLSASVHKREKKPFIHINQDVSLVLLF